MALSEFTYNPQGGSFSGNLPMKNMALMTYLRSVESLYRTTGKKALGAYYPVRSLPSTYIDKDSEWPLVMAAGSIVSVVNIKDAKAYVSADTEAGIGANGLVYVSIGNDGTKLQKSVNFLYEKDVSGLVTIANGGTSTTDAYTATDGQYGILDQAGNAASAASTGYTRPANVPFGIVDFEVAADMRFRYLNYDARGGSAGIRVCLDGILTLPYIAFLGAKSAGKSTAIQNVLSTVKAHHQYIWFDVVDQAELGGILRGGYLKPDRYGKFTPWVSGTDALNQFFASIKETRNRVPYNLDEIIDTFPNSGMTGTDTGGLTARLYNFTSTIVGAITTTSVTALKDAIKAAFITPITPTVAAYTAAAPSGVLFGQADVAFGLQK